MMFEQATPFYLHAISKKPLWIGGRRLPHAVNLPAHEMLYVTSISWKDRNQRYHGYMDDTLFIAFGIEDERAGVIDVVAGDLLASIDMNIC